MERTEKKYTYSEIFHSFQGEGKMTGTNTAWIRFFTCNLQCDGFGQKDPTDPSTYILPYKNLDVSQYSSVEELPVFEQGCDSSYTWSARYKHLAKKATAFEICDRIQATLAHETNPGGLFRHPMSRQLTDLAFTGGEPMLNQEAMVAIVEEFHNRNNNPDRVTVETNGTVAIKNAKFEQMLRDWYADVGDRISDEWFWSVSPKLFSTSGELAKKAIRPEVVAGYHFLSNKGQLKYVVNGTNQSWDEVEQATEAFRKEGVGWDVFIMVVGATKEQQESEHVATTAMEALKRGYHFSGRLHCSIFGNAIGT